MSTLTISMKKRWLEQVIHQTGDNCFFCHCENTPLNPLEWGHLNSKQGDNRPENFSLMCHTCNVKQKYSTDMNILANEQLKLNESSTYVCENARDDTGTNIKDNSCIRISQANYSIAEQFLHIHTAEHDELLVKDAVNGIVSQCKIQNGTGSQSAVYTYIETLTNRFTGKFTIYSTGDGDAIRLRTEN